jgi:hypothetical protein
MSYHQSIRVGHPKGSGSTSISIIVLMTLLFPQDKGYIVPIFMAAQTMMDADCDPYRGV